MSSLINHLRHMRGETSAPLIGEMVQLIQEGKAAKKRVLSVQVTSNMVNKGLTVLLPIESNPQAWIYLARQEVQGYIPPQKS